MLLLKSSSKKKKIKWMRTISGILPTLPACHRRRNPTQATHVSAVHSPPEDQSLATDVQVLAQLQSANSKGIISGQPASPSNMDDLKGSMESQYMREKDTLNATSSLTCDIMSSENMRTPCLLDECIEFKQLNVSSECNADDAEGGPLSALLSNYRSCLSKSGDAEKLAWLRSQLIGGNQEFLTPFGKRQLIYADHTASGRSLFFIENFITRHLLPFYGNTHTDDSYVGRRTSRMMKEAKEYIKHRMGGSDDDALVMCGWGCTAAIKRLQEVMGIAVPSSLRARVLDMMLAVSSNEERWLVFTGPYEHHSNLLSWRQSLAEVIEIPATEEGEIDMERLEAELQAAEGCGRVWKMGAFSACSNVTGLLTDTRAVARLLHKHGALACFDFAAGAPHLQVDMRSDQEDGYDSVVMSPHKLLGGPGTPGLLLMRKSLYKLGKHPPSTCGGGTVAYVNGFNEEGYEGLKPGWARLSLCYSMAEEELEYILSAIELVANYGQRYLALYDFDWCSGNWTYVHGKALESIFHEIGQLRTGRGFTDLTSPENDPSGSQRLRFRRYLTLAKALSHLLPKHPLPKPVPDDIDPRLLLFRV